MLLLRETAGTPVSMLGVENCGQVCSYYKGVILSVTGKYSRNEEILRTACSKSVRELLHNYKKPCISRRRETKQQYQHEPIRTERQTA